jgi:hypothetical protein
LRLGKNFSMPPWDDSYLFVGAIAKTSIEFYMISFRVRVPGKNFVVVSDAKLLPAIIGRPGLPKTSLYQMTRPVSIPTEVAVQKVHHSYSWCSISMAELRNLSDTPTPSSEASI